MDAVFYPTSFETHNGVHKASVDRCACVGVGVLPTVLSVRLQVVCSVEEDGEPHLSLLGCRMELVGSLMN